MATPSEKKCNRCGEVKTASLFYRHKRMKDGLFGHCIECHKAYGKRWAAENKELRHEIRMKSYLQRTYGISNEEYDKMRHEQGYCCRICSRHESEVQHGRLCVDHCHDSGKVRGLLCKKCNSAIGLLGENCDILRAAIEYLNP